MLSQHIKLLVLLVFIFSIGGDVSARPHTPDLSVIKPFAQGRDMMLLQYDGRERTQKEMEQGNRRMKHSYRMPEKMGNIVDGKLVPFA